MDSASGVEYNLAGILTKHPDAGNEKFILTAASFSYSQLRSAVNCDDLWPLVP